MIIAATTTTTTMIVTTTMSTEITELSSISLALPPSPPPVVSSENGFNEDLKSAGGRQTSSTVKFAIPSEISNATTDTLSTSMIHKDRDSRGSSRDRDGLRHRKSVRLSTSLLNSFDFVPPDEGTPAAQALAANAAIKVSRVTKGLKKLRGMKRPKMKTLNLVKQLNKKTKRKKKHFSKNFKGKVIDGVHELYTLSAGMMLGIRYSVGKLCGPPGEATDNLTIADFSYVEKVTFPPNGSDKTSTHITPPHQLAHTFKFKSYCPKIFKRLRDFFDTDASSYMLSVCGDYNFIEFISNSKSGQFFFYSHDGKYMIKTQTKEENKFLKRILPHYYKFLTENPYSTLVRIFGMYRVKMYHIRRKVHFVIMSSVFDTPAEIKTIYDLKGSSVGRSVSQKERENGAVLKDNDLLEDGTKLHLGSKKESFIAQLRKDAHFLASLNIMDYSLLVGIHDRKARASNVGGGSGGGGGLTIDAPISSASSSTPTPHSHEKLQFHLQGAGERLSGGVGDAASLSSDEGFVDGMESPSPRGGGGAMANSGGPQSSPSSISPLSQKRLSIASRSNTPFRRGSYSQLLPQPPSNHGQDETSGFVANRRMDSNSSPGFKTSADEFQDDGGGLRGDREGDGEEDGDDEYGEEDEEEEDAEDDADNDDEFEDIDAGDSGGEDEGKPYNLLLHSNSPNQDYRSQQRNSGTATDSKVGEGALGEEGYRLSQIFRASQLRSSNTDISGGFASTESTRPTNKKSSTTTSNDFDSYVLSSSAGPVYSPGITTLKPWTTRVDGGINCRKADGTRGDEIYYIGIIDILQQYNISKKAETFFKGFTNDVRQLSSIDSLSYAKRFMEFMEKNID